MAVVTVAQIKDLIAEIRDETAISGNTKERIATVLENIFDTTQQVDPSNFAAYNPDTEYNSTDPSFVSYTTGSTTNVYQYIYPTPATGIVPTNTSYWRLVSAGQFNHIQNTDAGTRNNWFEVQLQSQNQDVDGKTGFVLRGGQGSGLDIAIANLWDAVEGTMALKICYGYTGTGSDVWVDVGTVTLAALTAAINAHKADPAAHPLVSYYDGTDGFIAANEKGKLGEIQPMVRATDYEWLVRPTVTQDPDFPNKFTTSGGQIKISGVTYTVSAPAGANTFNEDYFYENYYCGTVYAQYISGSYKAVLETYADENTPANYAANQYVSEFLRLKDTGVETRRFNTTRIKLADGTIIEADEFNTLNLPGTLGGSGGGPAAQRTGLSLLFDNSSGAYYGSPVSPETGPAITLAISGNVKGYSVTVFHQASTEPTQPTGVKIVNGNYLNGSVNEITYTFYDTGYIRCTIVPIL